MPIDVCLTVDVEFDIAGTFGEPESRAPVGLDHVLCPVKGEEQGLNFILNTLNDYNQRATFFVETMNTAYFNDAMGNVTERLLSARQDVQLHLHPCWSVFKQPNWPETVLGAHPNDQCAGIPIEELQDMIESGVSILKEWGAPSVQALRTGNLSADMNVYKAMAKAGLTLASNIGAGYALPDDPDLHIYAGRKFIEGVLELPVFSYSVFQYKNLSKNSMLSITGSSIQEIKQLLYYAAAYQISPVVIITHPTEFVKKGKGSESWRVNRINQNKLRHLCRFLSEGTDTFRTATFGEHGDVWRQRGEQMVPKARASLSSVLKRMIENKLNDKLAYV